MQQEESKKISFWVNSMQTQQLNLLISRYKKNNNYIDLLFDKGWDTRLFPGVLEAFALTVYKGDVLKGIAQDILLAQKIFERVNQNKTETIKLTP